MVQDMARPLRIEYAGTKHDIHKLVPGLTGWTQVNGRDELPIPEKILIEVEYLQKIFLVLENGVSSNIPAFVT